MTSESDHGNRLSRRRRFVPASATSGAVTRKLRKRLLATRRNVGPAVVVARDQATRVAQETARQVANNLNSHFWDAAFKMMSIVLVPLTVAGMGWYWTRWQQSVNDLKSMIDLVTDKSPEKQKYGIAMFEYLAKNGKVPVEFLAAQIDYATTAGNHELLPMLEVAIQSASEQNPDVAEAYRVALLRRPSRVFVHVPNDQIYACLATLRDGFKDGDKASIFFPAVRTYAGYGTSSQELRFFHAADKARAEQIAGLFGTLGLELAVQDLSQTPWARTNAPNSYELWFSGKRLPPLCAPAPAVTPPPPAAPAAAPPAAPPGSDAPG